MTHKKKLPTGLRYCKDCGEPRGWSGSWKSTCLCDGLQCTTCETGRRRRPTSDYYDPERGEWWHTPYFAGHILQCRVCRTADTGYDGHY